MNNTIKSHRCFNQEDYKRLQDKGYDDQEIIGIWDRDIHQRVLSDLLWIEAQTPKVVTSLFAEFEKQKGNNPFISNQTSHE